MGIDGGATKTLAAVLDLQSAQLHLGHGGPSNQDAVGARAATQSLLRAADEAIERAGTSRDGLSAAVLAVAGTDTNAVAAHVQASCPAGWIVVNDVVGAWATATSAQPGIGVISGTGSNIFGVGPDARAWRTGGWGHILGDEGSGYWLGLQSLRAALHDRDGSGPATALSEAAVAFFGTATVEALAPLLYSKPLTKSEIAAFAIETAKLAERGDAVARRLYEEGARELSTQIAAVIERTGLDGAFSVGLIGSAFKAGEVFVGPLTRAIHALAPQAQVSIVEMAPVGGCLLLAERACYAAGTQGEHGRPARLDRGELQRLIDAAL
jgi:N-acetylglucosamine kinase-like BadF-type ATPase